MKTIVAVIVTALLVGGAAWGLRGLLSPGGSSDVPAPVRIEPAGRGDLVEFVTAPGKIEAKTKVAISARVAARIVELPCQEGVEVTKGRVSSDGVTPPSVLVKLDSKDLEAALRSSQARRNAQAASIDVEKAEIVALKAELRLKELELTRNHQLLETKDVSQSAVDELQSVCDAMKARIDSKEKNLVVLQHNLESAEAEIARAEDNLGYTTIVSPIDGVVTQLNSEVGELAIVGTTNTPGTTIMEVADLSRMILLAEVDEADIGAVRVGHKAKVRVQAYPDRVFDGAVTQIALKATQQQGQGGGGQTQAGHFEVEVLLDTKGERIFSGLSADVDIEIKSHANVLRVPSQAVVGRTVDTLPVEIQNDPAVEKGKTITPVVFRAIDGKAVATPVTIGASDGSYIIVEAGLKDEDPVITGPYKVLESLNHGESIVDETKITEAQRKAYYDRHAVGPQQRGPF